MLLRTSDQLELSSSSFERPKNEIIVLSLLGRLTVSDNGFVVHGSMYIEIMVDNSYKALHSLNISVQEMTRGYASLGAN